jgi:outer membrane protein TolC
MNKIIYPLVVLFFSMNVSVPAQTAGTFEQNVRVTELSIDEATDLALSNSLDIQLARYDVSIARTGSLRARSLFDTYIKAEAEYGDSDLAALSSSGVGEAVRKRFFVGAGKRFTTGTAVSIGAEEEEMSSYHEGSLSLSVSQALGRNFFGLADRAALTLADLDIENAEYTSLDVIEDSVAAVRRAYWQLAFNDRLVTIASDMLAIAERLYRAYSAQVELGAVEEAELLATEANVKVAQNNLQSASLEREAAKNRLLFLLNAGEYSDSLVVTSELDTGVEGVDILQSLERALETRRDYARLLNQARANDITLKVNRNALWPEIDLSASLAANGIDTGTADAWDQAAGFGNTALIAGLSVSLPLENRQARADLEGSRLRKEQILLGMKQLERLILLDIHNAVNRLNTLTGEVNTAREIVELQRRKLDAEQDRILTGRSSIDTLIRYQEDLARARESLASLLYQYNVARIDLARTQNVLLERYYDKPFELFEGPES